jgi:elongation factor P hydroxylase
LAQLVDPVARGDSESFLRWMAKSTRKLAAELKRQRCGVGDRKVAELLHQMGYSLQADGKNLEGKQLPDRNAQFEYVHTQGKNFLEQGLPVISIDTKKRDLVGNHSNRGQQWQLQAEPQTGQGDSLWDLRSGTQ